MTAFVRHRARQQRRSLGRANASVRMFRYEKAGDARWVFGSTCEGVESLDETLFYFSRKPQAREGIVAQQIFDLLREMDRSTDICIDELNGTWVHWLDVPIGDDEIDVSAAMKAVRLYR